MFQSGSVEPLAWCLRMHLPAIDEGPQIGWINPIPLARTDENVGQLTTVEQGIDVTLRAAEVVGDFFDVQELASRRVQRGGSDW